jgi:hypothetical protein
MKTTKELIIADITAKVEAKLASQKVELSLIDDFTKSANPTITNGDLLKKESDETQKNLNTYFKLKSDLEDKKKSLEIDLKTAERRINMIIDGRNNTSKIYQDLVNKASDLGINYPKNIDVIMKEIENLVQYIKSISPKNVKL